MVLSRGFTAVLASLAVILLTHADAMAQPVAVAVGAGVTSCQRFTAESARLASTEDTYFHWAQGFMTGVNIALDKMRAAPVDLTPEGADAGYQKRFIRSYCRANPEQSYQAAVLELLNALRSR